MRDWHQYSNFNLLISKWQNAAINDQELLKTLESLDSLNDKEDTFLLKALTYLGIGEKEEALKVFKKVFVDEPSEP